MYLSRGQYCRPQFGAALIRGGRALGGAYRSSAAASERFATLVVHLTLVDASAAPHRVRFGQRGLENET